MSLIAETNDVDFYDSKYSIAWEKLGTPYFKDGAICFKNYKVAAARLLIFKDLFMPHPFNCRYEHDLFELEALAEDYRIRLHNETARFKNYKRSRRKRMAIITTIFSTASAVLGTIGGIKLGTRLAE